MLRLKRTPVTRTIRPASVAVLVDHTLQASRDPLTVPCANAIARVSMQIAAVAQRGAAGPTAESP